MLPETSIGAVHDPEPNVFEDMKIALPLAHEAQDLRVGEAQRRQPVERDPRQHEDGVAGVDRLRDAVRRPQGGPVAALAVAVLDVVVDQAEVVAQLDSRRAGERALP